MFSEKGKGRAQVNVRAEDGRWASCSFESARESFMAFQLSLPQLISCQKGVQCKI